MNMIEHAKNAGLTENECFMKLSDMASELLIRQERAQAMSDELAQDYFSTREDVFKICYHDRARIQNEIALDYLNQMGDILNEVEELMREYEHKQVLPCEIRSAAKEREGG